MLIGGTEFLVDNLEKVEKEFKEKTAAATLLAEYSKKKYEMWQKKLIDPLEILMQSMYQASKNVPMSPLIVPTAAHLLTKQNDCTASEQIHTAPLHMVFGSHFLGTHQGFGTVGTL